MSDLLGHLHQQLTRPSQAEGSTVDELRRGLSKTLGRPVSDNFVRRMLHDLEADGKVIQEYVKGRALDKKQRYFSRYRLVSAPVRTPASPSRKATSR